ncbi:uncharacterized protein LOC129766596 [Toxorhynchites rutilus septentrionalis]|uniref:uncharacterized protein LOC129766596 n=1 Tax=Toxorhynchites rutilus septentrionalis TaxID=329112 RepID=UPI00247AB531|nr:uncharacterized protein LOC129766596 [Toxorhynchites rutilus septentrionalis]
MHAQIISRGWNCRNSTGQPPNGYHSSFEKRVAALSDDADKYAFLIKCLEYEPARNTCEALENLDLPFNEAWAKLEERFYNKRVAFEGYFFNLLKIRKIMKPSQRAILGLIDAVDTLLSATKQIANEPIRELDSTASGLLVCLVKERLDEYTLTKVEEKLDLQRIYKWNEFKSELEKLANQLSCKSAAEAAHQSHRPNQKVVATTAIKAITTQERKGPQRCFFCASEGHTVFDCPKLSSLSPQERWEAVKTGGHCFNCLAKGHQTKACKSTKTCQTCKSRHHSLLHQERQRAIQSTTLPIKVEEATAGTSQPK